MLRRLPAADLAALRSAELAEQADAWLTDLSAMLARGVAHRPRPDPLVEPGIAVGAVQGTLSARRGVVWVSEPPTGAGLFLSLIDPAESRSGGEAMENAIPLTPASWLTLMEETRLSACSSEALADEKALLPALASFHATAFMVFQAAVARLGTSFGVVASIMPTFEQVRPFLAEPVETDADGEPVEHLGGDVLFDRVSLRYDPDGPLTLDDVSMMAMPMGILTPVGASAAVTSGGESQRIAIARALMRNPRILLLDEATNWLDNDSQARVMANLAELTSTRLVIAHRLSTLRQADRIYVMKTGKVVQEGTFAELSETAGVFRDLVRRQMA